MIKQKTDLVLIRKLERPSANTKFRLYRDFVVDYSGWEIRVPKGFETDLASVPRFLRSLVSKVDGIEAAVVHDYLYVTAESTKDVADKLFYLMLENAVPQWKRYFMYLAVYFFGKGNFNAN
jgi:hypothetical protein